MSFGDAALLIDNLSCFSISVGTQECTHTCCPVWVGLRCCTLPFRLCSTILRQYEGVMRVHNFMGNSGGGIAVPAAGGSGRSGKKNKQTADARESDRILADALQEITVKASLADGEGGCVTSEMLPGGWECFTEGQREDDRFRREIFAVDATPLEPGSTDTVGTCSDDWIQVRVVGSSFVLHQIRKMIGAALYCLWGQDFLPRQAFNIALQGVLLPVSGLLPSALVVLFAFQASMPIHAQVFSRSARPWFPVSFSCWKRHRGGLDRQVVAMALRPVRRGQAKKMMLRELPLVGQRSACRTVS
jgi:hypothetical protein